MPSNPYLNRYKDRLKREEEQRQAANNLEDSRSTLKTIGTIGAGLAVAHKATPGGLYKAGAKLGTELTAMSKGLKASKPAPKVKREMKNFLDPKRRKADFGKAFQQTRDRFSEVYEKTKLEMDPDAPSRSLNLVEQYTQGKKELSGLKHRLRRDKLRQEVLSEIDTGISAADDQFAKQLQGAKKDIQHKVGSLHRQATSDQLKFQYEMGKLGEKYSSDVQKFMTTALSKTRDIQTPESHEEIASEFQKRVLEEAKKRGLEQQKRGAGVKGPLKGAMDKVLGYEQASAKDLQELHQKGEISLQKEAQEFLSEIEKDKSINMGDFFLDENLLIKDGELVDTKVISDIKDKAHETFSSGIIGKVLFQQDRRHYQKFKQQTANVMRPGQPEHVLSNLKAVDDEGILQKSLVRVGDKVYDAHDPSEPLREGLQFTSGRFGATQRILSEMAGAGIEDKDTKNILDKALDKLDLQKSKDPTLYEKAKSVKEKYSDEDWMRNRIEKAFATSHSTPEDIFTIEEYLKTYSEGFDDDLLQKLAAKSGMKEKLSFDTNKEIVDTFQKVIDQTGNISLKQSSEVKHAFENDISRILSRTRIQKDPAFLHSNKLQTGHDLIKKEASKFLTQDYGVKETHDLFKELYDKGEITAEQFDKAKGTVAETLFEQARKGTMFKGKIDPHISKNHTDALLWGDHPDEEVQLFQDIVKDMSKKSHPWHSKGPVSDYEGMYKGDIVAINKMDTDKVKGGNWDYIKEQMNVFTHGRDDMSKVTYQDVVSYGSFSRLNKLLGEAPFPAPNLALSEKSTGSLASMMGNFAAKRVFPFLAGVQGLRYLNDYSDEVLPGSMTAEQRYERGKARTRIGLSSVMENTPIINNELIRNVDDVTPGSENLVESLHSIPVAGWAADWTGVTSGKSPEDWVDYYEHGMDPVREGRWWPLSNQPWKGEGVSHHEPNSYQQAMSEWEYTDTVHGSKDEYWEDSWFPNHTMLPTPDDPLRPFSSRFNPYSWEQRHRTRRPYPVSGEMFDPNNPFMAPLNITVGNILKPGISYSSGADRSEIEEGQEVDSYLIANYTGGDLRFNEIVPGSTVPKDEEFLMEQLGMEHGHVADSQGAEGYSAKDESAQIIAGQNEEVKAKGQAGSSQGVLSTSDTTPKGSVQAKQQIAMSNQALKEEAELGRVTGSQMSKEELTVINEAIKEEAGRVELEEGTLDQAGYTIGYTPDMSSPEPDIETASSTGLGHQFSEFGRQMSYVSGSRGFMLREALGFDHGEGERYEARASQAYASSSRFWDANYGGRGMALSEVLRRVWQRPPGRREQVNELPNEMPAWMPGDDHYIDFTTGDPYAQVDRGEIRLPGEAYESLHNLHPDEYGKYGAVDRAAILADVAPHSKEAEKWLNIARERDLSEEEQEFLDRALERSSEQQRDYFITPYQFKGDVEKDTATVEEFVGPGRFTVEEDDEVYRMAGMEQLDFSGETEESLYQLDMLQEHMMPGAEVELIREPHETSDDSSIPAVVESEGINVNRNLIEAGVVEEKDEDSTIEGHAKHTAFGRTIGRAWETASHANIPILHNKFIAAQSPKEHLERNNIYDKQFKDWGSPVDDIVKPAFHSSFAESPIMGGLNLGVSFGIGSLLTGIGTFGSAFKVGGAIGMFGASAIRTKETITGEAWIPEYREKEREVEQYFDRLEYAKNKRLFKKYKELAKEEEGVDLASKLENLEKEEEKRREEIEKLENMRDNVQQEGEGEVKTFINEQGRKQVELEQSSEYVDHKRRELNEKTRKEEEGEEMFSLGPYSRKAIEYRNRYKSTLFAVNPDNIDYERIYRALPSDDRDYFRYFSEENDPDKQDEILQLVSEDQARMYKILWGRSDEVEEHDKDDLEEYFNDYYLPDSDWVGWREGVDLDHAKQKVVDNEGMDENSFGLWKDHTKDEKLTPAPTPPGEDFDNPNNNTAAIRSQLQSVLESYDIDDLEIEVKPVNKQESSVNMNIMYDIRQRLSQEIEMALA